MVRVDELIKVLEEHCSSWCCDNDEEVSKIANTIALWLNERVEQRPLDAILACHVGQEVEIAFGSDLFSAELKGTLGASKKSDGVYYLPDPEDGALVYFDAARVIAIKPLGKKAEADE